MLNQVVIVGRLVKDIKIEDEKAVITLACTRPFKNQDGIYETDFIDVITSGAIAENTAEYCHKGDMIGIRGYIRTKMEDNMRIINIIADRITFLSSKKPESSDDLSA